MYTNKCQSHAHVCLHADVAALYSHHGEEVEWAGDGQGEADSAQEEPQEVSVSSAAVGRDGPSFASDKYSNDTPEASLTHMHTPSCTHKPMWHHVTHLFLFIFNPFPCFCLKN